MYFKETITCIFYKTKITVEYKLFINKTLFLLHDLIMNNLKSVDNVDLFIAHLKVKMRE